MEEDISRIQGKLDLANRQLYHAGMRAALDAVLIEAGDTAVGVLGQILSGDLSPPYTEGSEALCKWFRARSRRERTLQHLMDFSKAEGEDHG